MGVAECGHFRGVVNLKGRSLLLCVSIYISIYIYIYIYIHIYIYEYIH